MISKFRSAAFALISIALTAPERMFALEDRSIQINTGVRFSFQTAISHLLTMATTAIASLSLAVFVYGAFQFVLHAGQPDKAKIGKELMQDSLVGLAVVLGSYAILSTLTYLIS